MRKIALSRDLLYSLYVEQGMTLKAISEELGVSRQTVSNKLQEYSIPIRNSSYIQAHKPKPKKTFRKIPDYRNRISLRKPIWS